MVLTYGDVNLRFSWYDPFVNSFIHLRLHVLTFCNALLALCRVRGATDNLFVVLPPPTRQSYVIVLSCCHSVNRN